MKLTKETLVDAIVHLNTKDYTDLAEDFCEMGFFDSRNRYSPDCTALEAVLEMQLAKGNFNFKTITIPFSN